MGAHRFWQGACVCELIAVGHPTQNYQNVSRLAEAENKREWLSDAVHLSWRCFNGRVSERTAGRWLGRRASWGRLIGCSWRRTFAV